MNVLLSIAVLASLLLIAAGIWALAKRRGSPLKAGLMIAAGLVTLMNAWLWTTMPVPPG